MTLHLAIPSLLEGQHDNSYPPSKIHDGTDWPMNNCTYIGIENDLRTASIS